MINNRMATFTNKVTGQIYKLAGVKSIEKAWGMASFVCDRMSWNIDMFAEDITVRFTK